MIRTAIRRAVISLLTVVALIQVAAWASEPGKMGAAMACLREVGR